MTRENESESSKKYVRLNIFRPAGNADWRVCQCNGVKRNCISNAFRDAFELLALWCLTADRAVCFPLHHNFSFFIDDTRLSFATLHLLEHARTYDRSWKRRRVLHCFIVPNGRRPQWIWISNIELDRNIDIKFYWQKFAWYKLKNEISLSALSSVLSVTNLKNKPSEIFSSAHIFRKFENLWRMMRKKMLSMKK